MSATIIYWTLLVSQVMLAGAMIAACYRMIKGPRAQDRILALDAFYVSAMLVLVMFGIRAGTSIYFEVALIIGLLGFVSTVALSKFLMRGEVIE
jgi:multicomponent K+:H+ antiporter subunit F